MALRTRTVNPTIFREYIGSKPYPDNFDDFPDIINPEIKEFHFIIAFASEVYDESGKGTGKFFRNWTVPPIDGEMIRKLKNKYENVKVVISIGGRGSEYPFNPAEKEIWLGNATKSLIEIINDFEDPCGKNLIDGIDINYDTIIVNPNEVEDVFAKYIGRLISSLKKVVNVVSIAPSPSVQAHYQALFAAHENDIAWVNYQFYKSKIAGKDEFEKLYRQLANEAYPGHKLLAGFSTDPIDKGNLPREVFIEACTDLINQKALPGIFIWNANDSALDQPPFNVEKKAQELLTQN